MSEIYNFKMFNHNENTENCCVSLYIGPLIFYLSRNRCIHYTYRICIALALIFNSLVCLFVVCKIRWINYYNKKKYNSVSPCIENIFLKAVIECLKFLTRTSVSKMHPVQEIILNSLDIWQIFSMYSLWYILFFTLRSECQLSSENGIDKKISNLTWVIYFYLESKLLKHFAIIITFLLIQSVNHK